MVDEIKKKQDSEENKTTNSGASIGNVAPNPQYRNALANANSSVRKADPQQDYYKMLKDESYKALLNAQVQASISRDQAMKYTQNKINANGFGNQGLSESSNLGLQNQYRQSLIDAQNQYGSEIANINLAKVQDQQSQLENDFNNLTQFMSQSSSVEQLDNIVKQYGYIDNNGNLDLSNSGLDASAQRQLQTTYNLYKAELNSLENQEVEDKLFEGKQADITSGKVYATNGNGKSKLVSTLGKQLNALQSFAATNDVEGQVFKVTQQNGYGKESGYATYLIFRNGEWYYAPKNLTSPDQVKYEVKGNKVTEIK